MSRFITRDKMNFYVDWFLSADTSNFHLHWTQCKMYTPLIYKPLVGILSNLASICAILCCTIRNKNYLWNKFIFRVNKFQRISYEQFCPHKIWHFLLFLKSHMEIKGQWNSKPDHKYSIIFAIKWSW